jgi:hypothetical protein
VVGVPLERWPIRGGGGGGGVAVALMVEMRSHELGSVSLCYGLWCWNPARRGSIYGMVPM